MELVIAQSINDFTSFKKLLSASTDILVLDQNVMVELDVKGLKYMVIEDFYTPDEYYQDACIYHQKVDSLFDELDKACENISSFPYAYSGNEHFLLTVFDDFLYLEKLIQILQNKYEKIYLYATHKPEKITSNQFDFEKLNSSRVNSLVLFPMERSIKRKIQLIYNSIDLFFVKDTYSSKQSLPFKIRVGHFFNRLYWFLDRRVNFSFDTKYFSASLRKNIYVMQDAYESLYLKKYLSGFKYLNPIAKLRKNVAIEQPIDTSDVTINNSLERFTEENFYFLGGYIHLFINSYHLEVVGRISSFKEKFEFLIKKDKPSLLLFDMGTGDIFDSVCCYVANCYNIPVILFQHGGHSLFSYNPYQKSLECNQKVLKTLIAQSYLEVDKIQNEETRVICMGSIKQYEKNHTLYVKDPTKGILFCLGPNSSFRQLLNLYSINKKHHQSIEIMSTIENTSLSADIKLHPTGQRKSYYSYINIIKNNQYKNINVLYGSIGEVISGNYNLIIIDFLASAMTMNIFSLKIPVIIYDCDFDKIRISNNILSDLYSRCYIAKNKNELSKLLEKFKAGNLPSKWSKSFIDKYIYSVDRGNPGENIAKYIDSIVSNDKL